MFSNFGPGTVECVTISKQSLTCFEEDSVVVSHTFDIPQTGCGGFKWLRHSTDPACANFSRFVGSFSQSFEFSSTPSACKIFSERPGGRDPSAVKVSARYDAWRLQKRRKTETEKSANFERTFTPRGWLRSA